MDQPPHGKKGVVLVIDSDPAGGARLKRILNKYGYRVYTAVNLKEAVGPFQKRKR
ncbi:MAG: hypothetical protein JRF45_14915 [Deltaproteobacteria bacterium]|nr:hypothetical protein [Deltaproteobacteria bacterium]MBW2156438.1 hypothetical protein [Deltaproteobacteria bacterium]MBW2327726.1 hypothetical protein [Deltaproteobacteria bacterium]